MVLTACLIFGWFELLPDEYKELGRHVVAGAGFVSNFLLWSENGYFDAAAETKPLLHLWSLGVEEQFYIVWPLLLWLAWKWKSNLLVIIGAIAAFSFALDIWQVGIDPAASFYSPLTRFWELLIGSLLAYLSLFRQATLKEFTLRNSNLQAWSAVALLGVCFLLVTSKRAYPGWWTLLPTLGAALFISAGSQAWVNRTVLSNRILVWFGLISFPLYLWNWPLLTFLRMFEGRLTLVSKIAAIFVSVALAWLTYELIEKPIRFGRPRLEAAYVLAAVLFLVGSTGYLALRTNGFPGYGARTAELSSFDQYFENSRPAWHYYTATGMLIKYREDCDFYDHEKDRVGRVTRIPVEIDKSCYERTPSGKKVLFIWGDSHAQQLYYGLRNVLPKSWDILIVASSGCKPNPTTSEDSSTNYCQRSNWFAIKTIKETHPDVVIVAQLNGHNFDVLMRIGALLKDQGVEKVIFTGPTPQWTQGLPKIIMRRLWNGTPERTFIDLDEVIVAQDKHLKTNFSKQDQFVYVDLIDFFCNKMGCLTRIGADKKEGITSPDYGHLTPIASEYLAKNLLADIVAGTNPNVGSSIDEAIKSNSEPR